MTVAGLETAGLEAVGLDVVGLVTEGLVCVPLNPSCMTPLSAVTTFLSLMAGVDLLTEELFLTADLTAEVVALSCEDPVAFCLGSRSVPSVSSAIRLSVAVMTVMVMPPERIPSSVPTAVMMMIAVPVTV